MKRDKKPILLSAYIFKKKNLVGNAILIKIYNYLSEKFSLIIITNDCDLAKKYIPKASTVAISVSSLNIKLIRDLSVWFKVARKLNSLKGEAIFIFHEYSPITLWIKKTVFIFIHQFGTRNSELSVLGKVASQITNEFIFSGLRRANLRFAVSQQIIDHLNNLKIQDIQLITHAVTLSDYLSPKITSFHTQLAKYKKEGNFLINYTGWVAENRGLSLILESFKLIQNSENQCILVIAGADSVHQKIIDKFANEQSLADVIVNFGTVEQDLIPGILHYSDVCLSFLEINEAHQLSPPQKIIEYFAAGKPVIANKIATHNAVIIDGVNGLLTNESPEDITHAILTIKNNSIMQKMLSNNASVTAHKYNFVDVYSNLIEQIENSMLSLNKNER